MVADITLRTKTIATRRRRQCNFPLLTEHNHSVWATALQIHKSLKRESKQGRLRRSGSLGLIILLADKKHSTRDGKTRLWRTREPRKTVNQGIGTRRRCGTTSGIFAQEEVNGITVAKG